MITTNPYTHESNINTDFDLIIGLDVDDRVRELYYKHKEETNKFIGGYYFKGIPCHPEDKRFYVYAWYTNQETPKCFYVGKGTGSRYRHILWEIKKFEEGKIGIHNCCYNEYWEYEYLKEHYGIHCEKVIEGIADFEAIIYEQAFKLEMFHKGERLSCIEGNPNGMQIAGWEEHKEKEPTIEIDTFLERYEEGYVEPHFDKVDISKLDKVYLYDNYRDENLSAEVEKYVNSTNAHLFTSDTSKKVKAIIVYQYIPEKRYRFFKENGKDVYSATDVLKRLQENE